MFFLIFPFTVMSSFGSLFRLASSFASGLVGSLRLGCARSLSGGGPYRRRRLKRTSEGGIAVSGDGRKGFSWNDLAPLHDTLLV